MKRSKILDAEKVIIALEQAKNEMFISSYYNQGGDDLMTEMIKNLIRQETKEMIETAFSSFVIALTFKLQDCEVKDYPCALCYEEENK